MNKSLQPCAVSTKCRPLLPLVIAFAALVTQSAVAQVNTLTIEENPPVNNNLNNSLNVTYTPGAPTTGVWNVTFAGFDRWFLMYTLGISLAPGDKTWVEPENSSLSNVLTPLGGTTGQTFLLQSDVATVGSIQDEGTAFNVGLDGSNNLPINVVFDDDAATAEVPDTGSTFGLLAVALAGLVGARRLRSIRLA